MNIKVLDNSTRKSILLFAFISAIFLNSSFLIFFYMLPLLYCNYRYGIETFKRSLYFCFLNSIVLYILKELYFNFFSSTADSFNASYFFAELIFMLSLLIMLLCYVLLYKTGWQLRILCCTFFARIGLIPLFSFVEKELAQNPDIFSNIEPLFSVSQSSEELSSFLTSMLEIFKTELAWISILSWICINWYLAILILHRRYKFNPANYFSYLFEKIRREFVARKFLLLTCIVFFAKMLFSSLQWKDEIFYVLLSNCLYVLLFFYVARGIVVFFTVFANRFFRRIDLYFIFICSILIVPVIGSVVLLMLLIAGLAEDLFHIEDLLLKRKKQE